MLSERLSCDAGVCTSESLMHERLSPHLLPVIESQLLEYEKVSLCFLYFDDINICKKICLKCLKCPFVNFLFDENITSSSNWDKKLLECLFHIQHYLLLNKLFRLGKYDAERHFKSAKFVDKRRLIFYKICEQLSNHETSKLMESMPPLKSEKYLEIFILNVLSLGALPVFLGHLSNIDNCAIKSLLVELENNCPKKEDMKIITEDQSLSPILTIVKKEDVYPIKDPQNVGLCFIINQVNFKDLNSRKGSYEDVSLLEETMKYFHIDVHVFPDVPKKFFEVDLITNLKKHFKENHSVFFLVILSHGDQGLVFSSDEKPVKIDFLEKQLECQLLINIPKVVIIQACQGNKYLSVGQIATDGGGPPIECDQLLSDHKHISSYISDYLLARATVPGFKAFRNLQEGSWFIQSFCKSLREKENECIFSIMTHTINKVKSLTIDTKQILLGQQPEIRSLLDKKLYLKQVFNN